MRYRWDVGRVRRRVTGGPSTARVGLRATAGRLDDTVDHDVLELALRIGEAMLSLGASAVDVTDAIQRVLRAFGLTGCQVDLTFTAITLSFDRGAGAYPLTMMRVVEERVPDYGRLSHVLDLARDVGARPVAVEDSRAALDDAHARLDAVVAAPQQYRRWVVTAALAALAASVAVLLGGGPAVALTAAVTTGAIDRVVYALRRWGLPPFFQQAAGGAVAALVAVLIYVTVPLLPVEIETLRPSLVVASGIVVLLAGLSLVGAAEDAISGFPITAGARTFEVGVLTLGIVVGIGAVLDGARRFGVPLVLTEAGPPAVPLWLQAFAGAAVALTYAVASYARPRAVLAAGVVGGLAWLVLHLATSLGAGPAVASAAAAAVVGFVSEGLSRRLRVPSVVTSVCGIVPLLPGLAIYRGLFQVVESPAGGVLSGATALVGAGMIGIGIAAGVTLGEFLARPLRLGLRGRTARASGL